MFGDNGADGSVWIHGRYGQALVELLGRDNQAIIGAGCRCTTVRAITPST
jgi:hypothetical protein